MKTVFGSIINLHTDENYFWDGIPVEEVITELKKLPGYVYGVDWEYEGDAEECNIWVDADHQYYDAGAVEEFMADFNKVTV